MKSDDIIVAPATPPGEGGVAIVRLSGTSCLDIIFPYFRSSKKITKPESHYLYHGNLYDDEGLHLDEVMFVYMAAPRSFTAEDVVEIHCHGGHQTVERILSFILKRGVRLARAGEFSYRAFLNGRIDLSQAEAIADIIHARSEVAQVLALSQLDGQLSSVLHQQMRSLRDCLSLIEAWIDFPEEELPQEDFDHINTVVDESVRYLQSSIDTFNTGRLYAEGASLLLLGRPNVGKSSLLNALLGEERAIVTDIEGTTRDLLEEGLVINGIPVRIIDAAGIRESLDPIEKVGVERALTQANQADIILMLIDGSREVDQYDMSLLKRFPTKKVVNVLTKSDILSNISLPASFSDDFVSVSAKSGSGLDTLRHKIFMHLTNGVDVSENNILFTNQRHKFAAMKALEALNNFDLAFKNRMSLEFLAVDLKQALEALGDITGETTTDDVLGLIFSRFCIGK